jgi:hypothetical protein
MQTNICGRKLGTFCGSCLGVTWDFRCRLPSCNMPLTNEEKFKFQFQFFWICYTNSFFTLIDSQTQVFDFITQTSLYGHSSSLQVKSQVIWCFGNCYKHYFVAARSARGRAKQLWPMLQLLCNIIYCMFGGICTSHRLSNEPDRDTMMQWPGMGTQE